MKTKAAALAAGLLLTGDPGLRPGRRSRRADPGGARRHPASGQRPGDRKRHPGGARRQNRRRRRRARDPGRRPGDRRQRQTRLSRFRASPAPSSAWSRSKACAARSTPPTSVTSTRPTAPRSPSTPTRCCCPPTIAGGVVAAHVMMQGSLFVGTSAVMRLARLEPRGHDGSRPDRPAPLLPAGPAARRRRRRRGSQEEEGRKPERGQPGDRRRHAPTAKPKPPAPPGSTRTPRWKPCCRWSTARSRSSCTPTAKRRSTPRSTGPRSRS